MSVIRVSTTPGLEAALASAAAGDTISLAPGSYSGVVINGVNRTSPVVITSQYSSNPAKITDLLVQSSSNVSIQHIVMDATNDLPTDKTSQFTNMAVVRNSSKISFVNDQFHGAPNVTLNNSIEALLVENTPSLTVTQSSFQDFHDAINLFNSDHFSGTNNSFYRIYDDGYRGGGDNAVSIQHNTFNTFHMDPTDTDHPDTIQFWTTNTTKSANGFTISGNTFTRGVDGNAVQGIFFRDQVGNLPFLNVNITGNVYAGSLWTGIRVTGGKNVNVTGNTMTSYSDFTSRIELDSVSNGSVTYNHAGAYIYTGDTGLSVSRERGGPGGAHANPSHRICASAHRPRGSDGGGLGAFRARHHNPRAGHVVGNDVGLGDGGRGPPAQASRRGRLGRDRWELGTGRNGQERSAPAELRASY